MNFSRAFGATIAFLLIIITSSTLIDNNSGKLITTQQEELPSEKEQAESSTSKVSKQQELEKKPQDKRHSTIFVKEEQPLTTNNQKSQSNDSSDNISAANVKENERAEQENVTLEIARDAANNKDWALFLEVSKKIKTMPEYVQPMTLTMAIREEAPQHVFETLLTRGESFLPQHLTRIAISNKLVLLKRLIPLGLNIHAELPNGDNAINVLMKTLASPQTFEFLLQQNVAIQPGANGKDPLLVALEASLSNNRAIFYAAKLVENGAQPGAVHYSLVAQIKESNPKAYNLIKNNIPELLESS